MKIKLNKAVKYLNIRMLLQINHKPSLNHQNKAMCSQIKMKILQLQTIRKLLFQKQMMARKNNRPKQKKKMMRLIINPCLWLKIF